MPEPDWKALHKRSLRQNQPETYRALERSGDLLEYLHDIDRQARVTYAKISERLSKDGTWTADQVERTAREVVLEELVLVRDQETLDAEARGGYGD